ncbi:hypothetical protein Tco_0195783 [Tanacetum coccineum]
MAFVFFCTKPVFQRKGECTLQCALSSKEEKSSCPTSVEEDDHAIEVAHMDNDLDWELVPRPDQVMIITLKWIYKVKLDELGGVLKNKANQEAKGKWSG